MVNVLQWWDYSYHEVHSLGVLDHQAEQCGAAAGLVSREHHSGTPEFVHQASYGLAVGLPNATSVTRHRHAGRQHGA